MIIKDGGDYLVVFGKPAVCKPNDPSIGYAGFPYWCSSSWSVGYRGYAQFYTAKPTRKQIRALVDWVNNHGEVHGN